MAEMDTPGKESEESLTEQPAGASTTEKKEGSETPKTIPYDRFKEVNDRAREVESELEKLKTKLLEKEAADEKNRQAKLKEQQKFEELAQEWETKYNETAPALQQAAEQLAEHKRVLEEFAQSQMELVPDMFRPIVSAMPVIERLKWLTENKEQLAKPKATGIPGTPPGRTPPEMTDENRRKKAARTF
jgi:DNA repair exonuclease SbcCD ATPase subunit